jgi:hypothetical protein
MFCIFCASASTMEATNLLSICCDILCRTGVKTNGKKNLIFYLLNLQNSLKTFISRDWHHDRNCLQQECKQKRAQRASRSESKDFMQDFSKVIEEVLKIVEIQLQQKQNTF